MIAVLVPVILFLLVIFHIFVYHKYNWPGYVKLIDKIPGPPGIFYFGSTLKFYKLKNEGNGAPSKRLASNISNRLIHGWPNRRAVGHIDDIRKSSNWGEIPGRRNPTKNLLNPTKRTGRKICGPIKEMLQDIIDGFRVYGPTYRLWYSGVAVVFISDLEDIQTVLSSRQNNTKGILYRTILPWLGSGLLTSSGKKWQMMRKIITPTFHFSILHSYIEVFRKNAKLLLKVLEAEAEKEECDLPKFVTYCALDNVCETAMGISVNALSTGKENKYVQAIFRIGQILVERTFNPIYYTNASFAIVPLGREHNQLLETLHGFTYRVIKERKKMKEEIIENNPKAEDMAKKKISFLDMLLECQKTYSLSSQDIREEVDTFMFEGHDTTAASLNWILFELGHHPEVQEQCYEELQRIFGNTEREPTYQDLMEMTVLKRVIQEGLRLYPSVPVISRKFDVDIQLKDYLVPANTEIILTLYGIHRNPKVFADPDKFDPDRFLPGAMEERHPFSYIPFSAGQRNCVGQKFAMLEELVLLSSIIRRFRIQSVDERHSIKVVPEIILRPHKRLRFKITKRT